MVNNNQKDSSFPQWPEAAQTLMALMHAQGEVARLSEREQLFSSLLVSVNAVLWAFNWETRQVLYVSPAYERIFGRSAGLLLADYNQWRDSIYPDDLEYAERSLAEVLHKGAVEDREYRIIAADGSGALAQRQMLHQPSGRTRATGDHRRHRRRHHRQEADGNRAATPGDHRRADPKQQSPAFLRMRQPRIRARRACKARRWRFCCWISMTSK